MRTTERNPAVIEIVLPPSATGRADPGYIILTVSCREEIFAMAQTGGDILVEGLLDWGVEVIFGIPGDGINGVMEALRKRQDKIRFIQTTHEESTALMA